MVDIVDSKPSIGEVRKLTNIVDVILEKGGLK